MLRILASLLVILMFVACAKKAPEPQMQQTRYITHTIRNSGETLGVISKWYTGTSAHWQAIQQANPGLRVNRLKIGQTINIPEALAIKREPFSPEYIAQLNSTPPQQLAKEMAKEEAALPPPSEDMASLDPEQANPIMAEQPEQVDLAANQDQGVPPDITEQQAPPIAKEETPDQKLFSAVVFADVPQIKSLVAGGANVNYRENDRPLLAWASQNQSIDAVKALIESGAQIDPVDGIGHTALMRAADTNQVEIAKALLQAKANPNIKAPNGSTALIMAVNNGSAEMVKLLLENGADANITTQDGDSAALLAAQNNSTEVIKILAASKADLNKSNAAYTPLSYAISQENISLVKALLEAGADPNIKPSSGAAPIFQAVTSPEIVKLLLGAKANPNLKNDYGQTPIMSAIESDNIKAVEAFIAGGADINARDNSGNTPLKLAMNTMRNEIGEVLKKNGATE